MLVGSGTSVVRSGFSNPPTVKSSTRMTSGVNKPWSRQPKIEGQVPARSIHTDRITCVGRILDLRGRGVGIADGALPGGERIVLLRVELKLKESTAAISIRGRPAGSGKAAYAPLPPPIVQEMAKRAVTIAASKALVEILVSGMRPRRAA